MKEILSYIKSKCIYQNEPAYINVMKEKFNDKDIDDLVDQLCKLGEVFMPRPNVVRWLG